MRQFSVFEYTQANLSDSRIPKMDISALRCLNRVFVGILATTTALCFASPAFPQSEENPIPLDVELDPGQSPTFWLLAEPQTGIASIHPAQAPPVIANRLTEFPRAFVPLLPPTESGFQATLNVEIAPSPSGDHLTIVMPDLDYGFWVPLGDVPLGEISPDLEQLNLSPDLRNFILTYEPPRNLDALQVDRRRFLTGKQAAFLPLRESLRSTVPLELQQTYLLRSVQFQIPELLRTRQFTVSGDRRYFAEATKIDSSDLLIAVRPIGRRDDGSYRLVWRILKQYPNPELESLWEYID